MARNLHAPSFLDESSCSLVLRNINQHSDHELQEFIVRFPLIGIYPMFDKGPIFASEIVANNGATRP